MFVNERGYAKECKALNEGEEETWWDATNSGHLFPRDEVWLEVLYLRYSWSQDYHPNAT